MSGDGDDSVWLYRGVPAESSEVKDVYATGEIEPPREDRASELWRSYHMAGETETAYTSWTSDRSIAVAAAEDCASAPGLSGEIVIFRVRLESIDRERVFDGRADESEYLIEAVVDGVEISAGEEEEDE